MFNCKHIFSYSFSILFVTDTARKMWAVSNVVLGWDGMVFGRAALLLPVAFSLINS